MKEALLPSSTSAGSGLEDGTSCSSDSEASYDKAELQHVERSPWVVTGEYALAALLAITFMYTLAFSHTSHTQFSAGNQHTKHWWKARHDVPGWAEQHQQYVEEAIAASQSSALQLDFYGDAVVEAWRGTQHGEPHSRCQDAPDIFDAHFGRDFESHVWGVAGDAAQHLMWRLRNGEGLASEGPQLAVLMVGSTDLTYASFKDDEHIRNVANTTANRVHAVAEYLSGLRPRSHVLLVGLLPRGDLTLSSDQHLAQPSKFTPAIASINSDLQQLAASRQDMHFVDCGQEFTYEGETGRIHAALMPDGVNLNAAGMEQLASCLDPIIHDVAKQLDAFGEAHKHLKQ
ncbi:hypothetical protein WJX79_002842 [Trebouxia sp. C0005]